MVEGAGLQRKGQLSRVMIRERRDTEEAQIVNGNEANEQTSCVREEEDDYLSRRLSLTVVSLSQSLSANIRVRYVVIAVSTVLVPRQKGRLSRQMSLWKRQTDKETCGDNNCLLLNTFLIINR